MMRYYEAPLFSLLAGEASGDLLGGALLRGMRQQWPMLTATGIGGPQMQAQGFECWHSYEKLAIHGFIDALKNIRELLALRREMVKRIIEQRPNVFIGIDAPDFNFGVEKRIRQQGIKTVHFVSPSLWAWRGGRIHKIKQSTDLMLCLFPFEPEIYEKQGIAARYVGHPLADQIPIEIDRQQARNQLGLQDEEKVLVALLPGSRGAEIKMLAPVFLETAQKLLQSRPNIHFVLPAAPGKYEALQSLLEGAALLEHVTLTKEDAGTALAACNVALIASGTATLEAALYKRPMVVAYKISPATALILKRVKWYYLPWYSLPNILCNESVVPERIQDDVTADRLCEDLIAWLDSPKKVEALESRFTDLHHQLKCDTGVRATDAIAELLTS